MVLRPLANELPIDDELSLRPPQQRDAEALIAAAQDPEVARWTTVPSPYGATDFDAYLRKNEEWTATNDLRRAYAIVDSNDAFLGTIGVVRVRPEDENAEVGYWLAAHARGQGVITRALTAVVREALRCGFERVDAEVLVGNDASQRALVRSGFTFEGTLRSVGSHGSGDSRRRIDVHVYSIIRSDDVAQKPLRS